MPGQRDEENHLTVLKHHFNGHKNDFANWIGHVFKDAELAQRLKRTRTKEELLNELKKL